MAIGNAFGDNFVRKLLDLIKKEGLTPPPCLLGTRSDILQGSVIAVLNEDLTGIGSATAKIVGKDDTSGAWETRQLSEIVVIQPPEATAEIEAGTTIIALFIRGIGFVVIDVLPTTNIDVECLCTNCVDVNNAENITDCGDFGTAPDEYTFTINLPCCTEASGIIIISHSSSCTWLSNDSYNCGSGYAAVKWTLEIDGVWVVLYLDTDDGKVQYRKRLDEWMPLCNNIMELDLTDTDQPSQPVCANLPCELCVSPIGDPSPTSSNHEDNLFCPCADPTNPHSQILQTQEFKFTLSDLTNDPASLTYESGDTINGDHTVLSYGACGWHGGFLGCQPPEETGSGLFGHECIGSFNLGITSLDEDAPTGSGSAVLSIQTLIRDTHPNATQPNFGYGASYTSDSFSCINGGTLNLQSTYGNDIGWPSTIDVTP